MTKNAYLLRLANALHFGIANGFLELNDVAALVGGMSLEDVDVSFDHLHEDARPSRRSKEGVAELIQESEKLGKTESMLNRLLNIGVRVIPTIGG